MTREELEDAIRECEKQIATADQLLREEIRDTLHMLQEDLEDMDQ